MVAGLRKAKEISAKEKKAKETAPACEPKDAGKVMTPNTCDIFCVNYGKSLSDAGNQLVWTTREFNKKVSKLSDFQEDPTAID